MEKTNKFILNITKGVGISFISTISMLLIYALLLVNTNIQEETISPVINIIAIISLLIGSSIANIKIKKNGILNGGVIGLAYMLIIYAISSLLNSKFGFDVQTIIFIVIGVIFGVLGGIIGINKKT